ncbi:MAG: GNAT family N-acetyltransferase [Cyanobacteria bacterium P01_D01_bin.2]
MVQHLVPKEFDVPAAFEMEAYRLRMLTVNDVVKDFDAVITSADHLKGVFPPPSTWPDGLSLEQDLIDLGWHQKEFQRRTSFAYTMMSLDESRCLGCVYFYPSDRQGYDALALLWARQSELAGGLEERLFADVRQWLKDRWPFESVAFPGRDFSWEDWFALPQG